ncbi:hypothetical protein CANARDRAFT_15522 [[Candida] arabinofermentans NRRL YB-2248]|uniref:Uncharacterized protein n=1 Tax=[Candida] arabinofermentans NRRL YB-2248 TaxID=983967 RepID=A0A1E4T963_9ASCO|nr:hypothetical protein CANARDRAFT_15522 [[Candida] arabinofermentans NRRL YB-2248]
MSADNKELLASFQQMVDEAYAETIGDEDQDQGQKVQFIGEKMEKIEEVEEILIQKEEASKQTTGNVKMLELENKVREDLMAIQERFTLVRLPEVAWTSLFISNYLTTTNKVHVHGITNWVPLIAKLFLRYNFSLKDYKIRQYLTNLAVDSPAVDNYMNSELNHLSEITMPFISILSNTLLLRWQRALDMDRCQDGEQIAKTMGMNLRASYPSLDLASQQKYSGEALAEHYSDGESEEEEEEYQEFFTVEIAEPD